MTSNNIIFKALNNDKPVTFKLDKNTYEDLKKHCKTYNIAVSYFCRELVKRYLNMQAD